MQKLYTSLILLFLLTSCSQNPNPAVNYLIEVKGTSNLDGVVTGATLEYSGRDFFGSSCSLEMKKVQDSTNSYRWRAQTDYILHGTDLPQVELYLYTYSPSTNRYNLYTENTNATQEDLEYQFIGIRTADVNEFDPNKLEEYESTGLLRFFLKVEFKEPTDLSIIKKYVDTINLVNLNPELFSENQETLDQVNRLIFKALHGDHYDAGGCLNYSPLSMIQEESNL